MRLAGALLNYRYRALTMLEIRDVFAHYVGDDDELKSAMCRFYGIILLCVRCKLAVRILL